MAKAVVTRDRACAQCGISPITRYKYCSTECHRLSIGWYSLPHDHQCERCGTTYTRRKRTGRYCSDTCRTGALKAECRACGSAFHTSAGKTVCKPCAAAAKVKAKAPKPERDMARCLVCDALFQKKSNSTNKACSRACGFVIRKWIGERQTAFVEARDMLRRWGERTRSPRVMRKTWRERYDERMAARKAAMAQMPCSDCGDAVGYAGNGPPRTRCVKCTEAVRLAARRIAKGVRRARLRAARTEAVDPIKVFERDGWRCHLCGSKTPKTLRGTYKRRAPELDHIVPLSKGGDHSYANTACSCRQCNIAKSDKMIGQPSLFGVAA